MSEVVSFTLWIGRTYGILSNYYLIRIIAISVGNRPLNENGRTKKRSYLVPAGVLLHLLAHSCLVPFVTHRFYFNRRLIMNSDLFPST